MPVQTVQPLSAPHYEEFTTLTRCLHFDDFLSCWKKRAFIARRVVCRINPMPRDQLFLWFAPSKPETEHNFYGNVSLTIPLETLFSRFEPQFFTVDQNRLSTHMYTRIILSRKQWFGRAQLITSSPNAALKNTGTKWYHATRSSSTAHELEIAIHVTPEDCVWLFRKCKMNVNNHGRANEMNYGMDYAPHICHRYNLNHRHCPYSVDNETAVKVIRAWVEALASNGYSLTQVGLLFDQQLNLFRNKQNTGINASFLNGFAGLSL